VIGISRWFFFFFFFFCTCAGLNSRRHTDGLADYNGEKSAERFGRMDLEKPTGDIRREIPRDGKCPQLSKWWLDSFVVITGIVLGRGNLENSIQSITMISQVGRSTRSPIDGRLTIRSDSSEKKSRKYDVWTSPIHSVTFTSRSHWTRPNFEIRCTQKVHHQGEMVDRISAKASEIHEERLWICEKERETRIILTWYSGEISGGRIHHISDFFFFSLSLSLHDKDCKVYSAGWEQKPLRIWTISLRPREG
jgi:hypothetical protein